VPGHSDSHMVSDDADGGAAGLSGHVLGYDSAAQAGEAPPVSPAEAVRPQRSPPEDEILLLHL